MSRTRDQLQHVRNFFLILSLNLQYIFYNPDKEQKFDEIEKLVQKTLNRSCSKMTKPPIRANSGTDKIRSYL